MGLLILYGIDWRAKDIPTDEIKWDNIKRSQSKISLNNMKLNDIVEFLEFNDETGSNTSGEYTLRSVGNSLEDIPGALLNSSNSKRKLNSPRTKAKNQLTNKKNLKNFKRVVSD